MKTNFLERTRPSGCPAARRGKNASGGWAPGQPEGRVLRFAETFPLLRTQSKQAMMLIECLLYIGMFFVILGVAFNIFYVCWDSAKALRRNTDQIAATVRIGERWRQDVRSATASLHAENSTDGVVLRIPEKSGEIAWKFSDGVLWRRKGANGTWTQTLAGVKSSRMESDRRGEVTAWRWEVELTTRRKGAKVVPLFTFEAVPNANSNQ